MTDTQVRKQVSATHIDQQLRTSSSPSFGNDEMHLDNNGEVLKTTTNSARSEKTLSIEEDEAQVAQSKSSLPLDKNELTPNTTSSTKSLKETPKSEGDAPPIIDLTHYEDEKVVTVDENDGEKANEIDRQKDDEEVDEKMTESTPSSKAKNTSDSSQKSKRKSKRASSTKRKSKVKTQKSEEETGNQETSSKKRLSKTKSVSNTIGSADGGSSKRTTSKSKSSTKPREEPSKFEKTPPTVPATPTKKQNGVVRQSTSTPNKKDSNANDFQKRKEAKEKRADDLRNYLGTVGDTLMVEPRSDDSVSYLTMPPALEANGGDHDSDLNKLPKSQVPPQTVNPMIKMGDDGECEPDRRLSYDLEALMRHKVPTKSRNSKWENVSVITDDVETVLGEDDNAEVVNLQSHDDVKLGDESGNMEFADIDLEQTSKEVATAVDCKLATKTTVVSILEDLQSLMIRKPITASVVFVFLVAALVVLGMALMQ
ncbi:unnamed protein product [Cylindrotheca closterium]|uniref:Uncharacterized protein n=1 Tax=Cylindrotheca closterium TaxID=2856 RepID=A0AAD2G8P5_9STRA|nr:unnamed protein product [Cylindrotheca closterium]